MGNLQQLDYRRVEEVRPRLVVAFSRLIFQCNPMQNVTRRRFEELESSASEIFQGFRRNQQGHWQQQAAKHEKSQCFWGPWSTMVPMVNLSFQEQILCWLWLFFYRKKRKTKQIGDDFSRGWQIYTPKELLGMGINRGNHPKIGERRIQESLRIPKLGCQLIWLYHRLLRFSLILIFQI